MSMLSGGLGLAWAAAKSWESIPPGVKAVKLRWGSEVRKHNSLFNAHVSGERYGIKSSGPAFSLPGMERYVHITTRPDMEGDRLQTQEVLTAQQQVVKLGGSVVWHVMEDVEAVYRALDAVNNRREIVPQLKTIVLEQTQQTLGKVMMGKSLQEMVDFDARRPEIIGACAEPMHEIGVNLKTIYFDMPIFTDAEVQKQAMIEAARIQAEAQRQAAVASATIMANAHLGAATEIATAIRESGSAVPLGALGLSDAFFEESVPQPSEAPAFPLQVLPGGYSG